MRAGSCRRIRWILGEMASQGFFNQIGAFESQFTPVEGGYLYYPSGRSGGKLVTVEEFEILKSNWQRVAGRGGRWKTVGIVFAGIFAWTVLSSALQFPGWTDSIAVGVAVVSISTYIIWASFAPRRLVRGRPEITPPRPRSEAKRVARSALNWRFVGIALLVSGSIFSGSLASPTYTLSWWAWTIGSGLMFAAYVWIALLKIRDNQSKI